MANMEKEPGSETGTGFRYGVLVLFLLIQTTTFVTVTVLQFRDINDLEFLDRELQFGIQRLQALVQEAGFDDISDAVTDDNEEVKVMSEAEQEVYRRLRRHVDQSEAKRQSGFLVDILKAQEMILERHCHDLNKTCPQGSKGEPGMIGDKGITGDTGTQGLAGIAGFPGPKGPPGEKGVKGSQGISGDPGTVGASGARGDQGQKGEMGLTGISGIDGSKGERGVKGLKGETGNQGIPGSVGYPGNKGSIGDKGQPGQKGAKGEPGIRGPKGQDVKAIGNGCDCFTRKEIVSILADI